MESVSVERLDHVGVVASVIKGLGLIERIDARWLLHDQEEITAGEAVFICKPSVLRHRPRPKRHGRDWPEHGAITRWNPLRCLTTNAMATKAGPQPRLRSAPSSGRCQLR